MKKIQLFAMAFAALAMASCNNDDEEINKVDLNSGQKVYANFSIQLPSTSNTRALGDESGNAIENVLTDCRVFVYKTDGTLEKEFPVALIEGQTQATGAVEVETGSKTFVAVVNGLAARMTTAPATVTALKAALLANATDQVGIDVLMTSSPVEQEIKVLADGTGSTAGQAIKVRLDVNRAVAKAYVRGSKGDVTIDAATVASLAGATLQDITFAINGQASDVAAFQQLDATGLISNHVSKKVSFYPVAPATTPLTYTALDAKAGILKDLAGNYLLENIAGKATLNGQATQIYIKATILPTGNFTAGDGTAGAAIAANATYVRMEMADHTMKFFASTADATTYNAAFGTDPDTSKKPLDGKAYEYVDGANYYRVLFKPLEPLAPNYSEMCYSVIRNFMYDVQINSIKNWGAPNDKGDLVNPDEPIDNVAWIDATVFIHKWTVKTQTEDLK